MTDKTRCAKCGHVEDDHDGYGGLCDGLGGNASRAVCGCEAFTLPPESPTHPDAPRAGGETPTTLKPCPFCGGDEANGYLEVMNENEGIGNENGGEATPYYRVVCHECNGLTEGGRLESHAIAAWNRRAALPSSREG